MHRLHVTRKWFADTLLQAASKRGVLEVLVELRAQDPR
jgi:hypothetical protein